MSRLLASKIEAANEALIGNEDLRAIGEFFTSDYVAHPHGRGYDSGHGAMRRFIGM